MSVGWVQPFLVKDVVVAWRRRMEKSRVCGVWKMIPLAFGGVYGRKGIVRFFRVMLCPFNIEALLFRPCMVGVMPLYTAEETWWFWILR